jgi:hypothetical protein
MALAKHLHLTMEFITAEKTDRHAWLCVCGNTPVGDGFFPCDEHGNEMVPDIGSDWNGLYVCARCGRIIKQDTLEVVGRNPHPNLLA